MIQAKRGRNRLCLLMGSHTVDQKHLLPLILDRVVGRVHLSAILKWRVFAARKLLCGQTNQRANTSGMPRSWRRRKSDPRTMQPRGMGSCATRPRDNWPVRSQPIEAPHSGIMNLNLSEDEPCAQPSRRAMFTPISGVMQHLDLSDEEAAALIKELADITGSDRYPFSSRIQTLRAILAKLRPEPVREPLRPPKVYVPPRATAARRRRRG
jgi:hypothetical protein